MVGTKYYDPHGNEIEYKEARRISAAKYSIMLADLGDGTHLQLMRESMVTPMEPDRLFSVRRLTVQTDNFGRTKQAVISKEYFERYSLASTYLFSKYGEAVLSSDTPPEPVRIDDEMDRVALIQEGKLPAPRGVLEPEGGLDNNHSAQSAEDAELEAILQSQGYEALF